jgi:hypothetical protein
MGVPYYLRDKKQVEFDVLAVEKGATTATGLRIQGVMYRGECFGCGPAAIFRTATLVKQLVDIKIPFYSSNWRLPWQ